MKMMTASLVALSTSTAMAQHTVVLDSCDDAFSAQVSGGTTTVKSGVVSY